MQLTFGNMTLELNIFHLSKKHMQPVEEVQEEVCIIDTIMKERAVQQQMQDVLTEELVDCPEKKQEADSCHSRCTGINKIYILNPTVVAKLLQYSGSRVEHRDGFSSHK